MGATATASAWEWEDSDDSEDCGSYTSADIGEYDYGTDDPGVGVDGEGVCPDLSMDDDEGDEPTGEYSARSDDDVDIDGDGLSPNGCEEMWNTYATTQGNEFGDTNFLLGDEIRQCGDGEIQRAYDD